MAGTLYTLLMIFYTMYWREDMDKIDEILEYVRRTNPEMTRDKLIEELGKCEYSARALIFGFQNVVDGSTRI